MSVFLRTFLSLPSTENQRLIVKLVYGKKRKRSLARKKIVVLDSDSCILSFFSTFWVQDGAQLGESEWRMGASIENF